MTNFYSDCSKECERQPQCTVCFRLKKPVGRDSREVWCTDECEGYRQEPTPGHLWPGEWELLGEVLRP